MSVRPLLDKIGGSPAFKEAEKRLRTGEECLCVHGLAGSLRAFFVAHMNAAMALPKLVVVPDEDRAERFRDDLSALLGTDRVWYFPAWHVSPYEDRSPSAEIVGWRIEALEHLLYRDEGVVITTSRALLGLTIPPKKLKENTIRLRVGEQLDRDALLEHLSDGGFDRFPMIEKVGQISVRGGILDVFPYTAEHPLRIEFFGDEVESIRRFDIASQRSLEPVEEIIISPAREIILDEAASSTFSRAAETIEVPDELRVQVNARAFSEGMEQVIALFYPERATLLEYVQPGDGIFVDDPEEVMGKAEEAQMELERLYEEHRRRGEVVLPPEHMGRTPEHLRRALSGVRRIEHLPLKSQGENVIYFNSHPQRPFEGDLDLLRAELSTLIGEHYTVVTLCDNRRQAERLQELLEEFIDRIIVDVGAFHDGFIFPEAKVALFNDHEVFGRYRRRFRYRTFRRGTPISSFTALKRGDFIVHVDYGIGLYQGIQTLEIDGVKRDCLLALYRDNDKLYVPVDQLNRVQKYTGEEGVAPALSKLGGTDWERAKARTRKVVMEMAEELLQLYAERQTRPGHAFSPDSSLQTEMEASFIYEETPDQLRATLDVKRDLEKATPMDRLVCGDVGYGKTEVAIRAAFKAVNDSKQVAVLVPTTILAQQHHRTFSERLADFPVTVDVLSRFRTKKEQEQIIERLKRGQIDIIIGTHRLLSRDVEFRDLGLLVIDEEQRFGVAHKEKLKQLRRMVDVLTMTATPIPRTLHMSLSEARDMSIINTPPRGRLPVETEIIHFDQDRIAEAILREVDRGGQVYFVHNRVQSIDEMAAFLRDLLPEIRFGVAHGQMSERQLERVMLGFLNRRYDCLISTMIIESGLDIPNVNTLLINRADRFGLAQLYQLRGRVGRSNVRAFAYLIIPEWKSLNADTRRRLRAIEEFTDLGSGFRIAMRDMEIRGAGNILGPEQHGFITAVGFNLYCRLLEEAVRGLKGEKVEEGPDAKIEIHASAFLPQDYVPDEAQRVDFYRRLADARKTLDLLTIQEELKDRYGALPDEVHALIEIAHIRQLARHIGLARVQMDHDILKMTFLPDRAPDKKELGALVAQLTVPLQFSFDEGMTLEVGVFEDTEVERLQTARTVMEQMASAGR